MSRYNNKDSYESDHLARQAIELLSNHLDQHYGLTAIMGAELEFCIHPSKEFTSSPEFSKGRKTNILALENQSRFQTLDDYLRGFTSRANQQLSKDKGAPLEYQEALSANDILYAPSSQTPVPESLKSNHLAKQNPLFPDSPYIAAMHQEDPNISKKYVNISSQYEVIFSHKAEHNHPSTLARAIDSTRKLIQEKAPFYQAEGKADHSTASRKGKHIIAASFAAIEKSSPITNGMHINLSLQHKDNSPLVPADYTRDTALQILGQKMAAMNGQILPFFLPSNTAHKRVQPNDFSAPTSLHSSISTKGLQSQKPWFENRLPGADANPYHAIAGTLLSAVHMLKELDLSRPVLSWHSTPASTDPLPSSTKETLAIMRSNTSAKDCLNELSNGDTLGDKLFAAIERDIITGRQMCPSVSSGQSR